MSDRELLELAAKAAGYGEVWYAGGDSYIGPKPKFNKPIEYRTFNPLTDDGDALRLAVKLEMILAVRDEGKTDASVHIEDHPHPWQSFLVEHNDDPLAATRRAITRAAAEIGRSIK